MSAYGEIWKLIKIHTSEEIWRSIPEELVEALTALIKREDKRC